MVLGEGADKGCRRAEYDSWPHIAAPLDALRLNPFLHISAIGNGEKQVPLPPVAAQPVPTQGREGDGLKADCTFHTGHKHSTKLRQEESHAPVLAV